MPRQIALYCRAEASSNDPQRVDPSFRIFRRLAKSPEFQSSDTFVAAPNEQKRALLRITPGKATLAQ